jgi:SAM-dependent methyltransferase
VRDVVGVDPSPRLIAKARDLGGGIPNLTFGHEDGRRLSFASATFDAVVLHRVLSHVPEPEQVLAETFRVLRPGGMLAVFDGDYATITLAIGDVDPLEVCVDAIRPAYITDSRVVRKLPALVGAAGFVGGRLRSHGYVQIDEPDYMLSIVDRGADALVAAGTIGPELGEALKAEARRRVDAKMFFGHGAYASLTAEKPSS